MEPACLDKQPVPEIPHVEGLADAEHQDDDGHNRQGQGETRERPLQPGNVLGKVAGGHRRRDEGVGSEHGDGKDYYQWEVNPEPLKEKVDVIPVVAV